jgi:hypothetical protein
MFKLDNAFLEELGLGSLPPVEKNKMLAHIYETLEMRVGMKLAEQMSNEQLDEFESYINKQDEAGALKWLETNFPNYKAVVADELEKLKSEISQVAPQIVAQSQENAAANVPQPQSSVQQDQQLSDSQVQTTHPMQSQPAQYHQPQPPIQQYPQPLQTSQQPTIPQQPVTPVQQTPANPLTPQQSYQPQANPNTSYQSTPSPQPPNTQPPQMPQQPWQPSE